MLELYIMEACPYCRKVMDYVANAGIEYVKCDINMPQNHEKLMELGGQYQVPFLVDADVKMYESDDIIEYLKKKYINP